MTFALTMVASAFLALGGVVVIGRVITAIEEWLER